MSGIVLSVASGILASSASVFSKLALEKDGNTLTHYILQPLCNGDICHTILFVLRAMMFGLMLLSNSLMFTTFAKAMQRCKSSVEAVIINSATNLIATALAGMTIFGEILSLVWWFGASLVVIGVAIMWRDDGSSRSSKQE